MRVPCRFFFASFLVDGGKYPICDSNGQTRNKNLPILMVILRIERRKKRNNGKLELAVLPFPVYPLPISGLFFAAIKVVIALPIIRLPLNLPLKPPSDLFPPHRSKCENAHRHFFVGSLPGPRGRIVRIGRARSRFSCLWDIPC